MRARLAAISGPEAEDAAAKGAERLATLGAFEACDRVILYASLPDELPSRPIFERAKASGKRLLWPRIDRDALVFAPWESWETLVPGRFGVLVPPAAVPGETLGAGDLVLVPGRAFDRTGARLGRGGGLYDRALANRGGATTLGVGFPCQLVEHVPTAPHDQPMDMLLLGDQLVTFGQVEEPG